MLAAGVEEVAKFMYFLKYSASYSTTTSYFTTFFCTGGGIVSEYERDTSSFNIESLK